ncbi:MAG TPA: hypothetical protein VGE45_06975 [Chloroflexia bacterium]
MALRPGVCIGGSRHLCGGYPPRDGGCPPQRWRVYAGDWIVRGLFQVVLQQSLG